MLRRDVEFKAAFTVSQKPYRAKLDQNESPYDLPDDVKAYLSERLKEASWNRYPQPATYAEVKETFAREMDVPADNVALTFGGDQTILSAFLVAGGPSSKAVVFEPTYPMFRHYALATGTPTDFVILGEEYSPSPDDFKGKGYRLITFVSPNNPTGNLIDLDVLREALETGALVFVDEAYYPFARVSVWDAFKDYPNLMVGRSLSKSMLAGMRMGYVLSSPEVIAAVEHMNFAPYNLTHLHLTLFREYGVIKPHLNRGVDTVIAERERIFRFLRDVGLNPFPSFANFVMFKTERHRDLYNFLTDFGVRIRDVSGLPGLSNHLRVTVGRPEENAIFMEGVRRFLGL
ncbi:MAG: aminotransferase class I/II-fold pyridoxal phosphate-dependent enzyme [Thermotogae bacterium]|nr:aminotransferase class I/II-fold pyridoxal phosphate-dependent enzyme [Thermotogota bacterium]